MTRRVLLAALASALTLPSVGCCGRVRSFFYRLTHCPGCHPAYGVADGPVVPTYAGPVGGGPVFDGGVPAGPVGGPGCSTCMSGGGVPPADHGIPVVPGVAYGGPVFGGPPVGSGPIMSGPIAGTPPQQMAPPMVGTEPPKGSPMK
jgi:hypothetical protein